MMRQILRLLVLGAGAAIFLSLWLGGPHGTPAPSASHATRAASAHWANPASLPDHFARHGADFGARSADEYAAMAAQFLQRAKAEGLPAKIDRQGVLRIYDPRSGTFGAYNRDGTTKTFFKPGNPRYFSRQAGQPVNLKTWR